jgi:hypothetical protein
MKTIPKTIDVLQFENGDILLAYDRFRKECFVHIVGGQVMTYTESEMIEIYNYDPEL